MFPRLERIKKSVYARIKFVIFMKLKGIKSIKKGTSSYETIRHFINDLLPEKIEEIFYAVVECHYGIEFLYRIQEGWKYNEKGDERYIKRTYSKYWKEKGFNPNASIEEKLKFLYRKGEYEVKKMKASEKITQN